ncbi:DUF3465 domain-containing protein [Pontiella sulfatireligans]|uniref:DUF3465 domain-containing protein n=1 Tax=Pontiella sulfatireligans TaxID=2750658 RepID=UPI00109D12DE|nr:DUF3465 domain-containing protein [Pontiella sulfatireligans]
MKRILALLILIGIAYFGLNQLNVDPPRATHVANDGNLTSAESNNPKSGSPFSGVGTVSRILSDDNTGSRHQRFILKLSSNRTILIAHNIDVAPRIESLKVGDTISFNGMYEWNSKGGVVHWTHRDPNGRHEAGWLQKAGKKYQ